MKEKKIKEKREHADNIKIHKVSTPASKVTGGGAGPYPESWMHPRPGNVNKYG